MGVIPYVDVGSEAISHVDVPATQAGGVLTLYFVIQVIPSNLGLPILIATFLLAKSVKRHPLMINLCLCWILAGTLRCLLLYAGQASGNQPDKSLCATQSSLLSGIPPMLAIATLMLILHFRKSYDTRNIPFNVYVIHAMIAAPYFTLAVWATTASVLVSSTPNLVGRDARFFHCSIDWMPFTNAMLIFTTVVSLVTAVYEVLLGLMLYRNHIGASNDGVICKIETHSIVRILIFGVYVVFTAVFSLVAIFSPTSIVPDIFFAAVGLVGMIIFGSQADIYYAWLAIIWPGSRPAMVTSIEKPSPEFRIDSDEKGSRIHDRDSI